MAFVGNPFSGERDPRRKRDGWEQKPARPPAKAEPAITEHRPPVYSGPRPGMKACPTCGKQIAEGARTCPNCGHTFTTAGGIFIAVIIALVIGGCVLRLR